MATCVPIRDMKNTSQFSALIERSPEPVTVTRNGYDAFVVMRSADYQTMRQEVAKAQLLSRMAIADTELAGGDYTDGSKFIEDLRTRYGL